MTWCFQLIPIIQNILAPPLHDISFIIGTYVPSAFHPRAIHFSDSDCAAAELRESFSVHMG